LLRADYRRFYLGSILMGMKLVFCSVPSTQHFVGYFFGNLSLIEGLLAIIEISHHIICYLMLC